MADNVLVSGYEETCRGIKLLSNTLPFLISIRGGLKSPSPTSIEWANVAHNAGSVLSRKLTCLFVNVKVCLQHNLSE